RCTGELKNLFNGNYFADSSCCGWGIAFSASGRFLYTSIPLKIHQFDLQAANIAASRTIVAQYDGFLCPSSANFSQLRLAPDRKIYIANGNGCGPSYLGVIEYPDSVGTPCKVVQHSFVIQ